MPKFTNQELTEIRENTKRLELEKQTKKKAKRPSKKSSKKNSQSSQVALKERLIGPFLLILTLIVSILVILMYS